MDRWRLSHRRYVYLICIFDSFYVDMSRAELINKLSHKFIKIHFSENDGHFTDEHLLRGIQQGERETCICGRKHV